MNPRILEQFIRESNKIEDIHKDVSKKDIQVLADFLDRNIITIKDVVTFVRHFQPNAELRDSPNLNVRVGKHIPPQGGGTLVTQLKEILDLNDTPYQIHQRYENLHPFTDCNGRSGRAIWLFMMQNHYNLGFLHHWYYQSLEESR